MNMTEPICKYAKIGLIHFMAYPSTIKGEGSVEETIRKIALDEYFDTIEVTCMKPNAGLRWMLCLRNL